jgi:zinc/manganese transport system substrate-binding protein
VHIPTKSLSTKRLRLFATASKSKRSYCSLSAGNRTSSTTRSSNWMAVILLTFIGWVGSLGSAQSQTIFACEPEWAALTHVLLPQAKVHIATHERQDPHHIEARPALIVQLRAADAAICTGASLEEGWLPTLQQRAGNPRVQNGAQGLFFAASAVTLIDAKPGQRSGPFAGDVHAEGNPHLHADPRRLLEVAMAWSGRLQQLFPEQQSDIAQRLALFQRQWQARIPQWEARAATLRGKAVVAQHSSFVYLWNWLGVQQVADLEPKPGLAPSPGHLQRLLEQFRTQPPSAIVLTRYQDPRAAQWLAQQLGGRVPILKLPATVADPHAPDALGRWFDQVFTLLELS